MKADLAEEKVKSWFTGKARAEWRRLLKDPYHQIEFTVTLHFLEKYLPKKGLILDAGGGPGRYTIEMAKRGYDVVLLDLVPNMLKTAKRNIKRACVQRHVKQIAEGSIADLSMFHDETFDAVMCLGGPVNHFLDAGQRARTAAELLRVVKKNAPVFVSVISRMGLLRSMLTRFPHEMKYIRQHWEHGDYIPGVSGEGFTAAHWFLPEELRELFEKQGLTVHEMAGLEGLSSHHSKETNKLYKDKERWKMWMQIVLDTCTHPSIVGSSEHFLLVGRKHR